MSLSVGYTPYNHSHGALCPCYKLLLNTVGGLHTPFVGHKVEDDAFIVRAKELDIDLDGQQVLLGQAVHAYTEISSVHRILSLLTNPKAYVIVKAMAVGVLAWNYDGSEVCSLGMCLAIDNSELYRELAKIYATYEPSFHWRRIKAALPSNLSFLPAEHDNILW